MSAATALTSVTCEQHEDEEVRFYCEECKKMICDDCIIGGHKNHKATKLKEFGAKRREAIFNAITRAEDKKLPQIETRIKQANEHKINFGELVEKEIEVIKTKRKILDAILDSLQRELTDSLNDATVKAEHQFERFIKVQELKKHKIKEIIDVIKSKGSDMTDIDVAKYDVQLEDLLVNDSYADTVPNLQPPRYQFHDEFANKEKMQQFMGYLESEIYATVDPEEDLSSTNKSFLATYLEPVSRSVKTENSHQYTQLVASPQKSFQIISSFDAVNGVSIIVPKNENLVAWILDRHISEVDCSHGSNVIPKLLKTLDQTVISACTKNNDLLVALPNKNSLKLLQTAVNKITRNRSFSLVAGITFGSNKTNNLLCICNSQISTDEHIVCLQDKNHQQRYIIQWYKNGKPSGTEISSDMHKIDLDSPIQMCQNMEGDICIVCRPKGKPSWIVVINKNGKQLLRFPKDNGSSSEKCDFVGAGILKDKNITIADRENNEQILLSPDGKVLQKNKHDAKPVCCTVDQNSNVWVCFADSKVKVINYRAENEYAEVTEPATHF